MTTVAKDRLLNIADADTDGEKENVDQVAGTATEAGLACMFREGAAKIAVQRSENLFKQLEVRSLTDEEQAIIHQRVALQRQMFAQYEKQERIRKVDEIRSVVPDLTDEEAAKALEFCNNREDEATGQLVSDPNFKRRVKAACGLRAAAPSQPGPTKKGTWVSKPSGPRPKKVDSSKLGSEVFVGAFRGRGAAAKSAARKPAARAAPKPRKTATAAAEEDAAEAAAGEEDGEEATREEEAEDGEGAQAEESDGAETETENEAGEEEEAAGGQEEDAAVVDVMMEDEGDAGAFCEPDQEAPLASSGPAPIADGDAVPETEDETACMPAGEAETAKAEASGPAADADGSAGADEPLKAGEAERTYGTMRRMKNLGPVLANLPRTNLAIAVFQLLHKDDPARALEVLAAAEAMDTKKAAPLRAAISGAAAGSNPGPGEAAEPTEAGIDKQAAEASVAKDSSGSLEEAENGGDSEAGSGDDDASEPAEAAAEGRGARKRTASLKVREVSPDPQPRSWGARRPRGPSKRKAASASGESGSSPEAARPVEQQAAKSTAARGKRVKLQKTAKAAAAEPAPIAAPADPIPDPSAAADGTQAATKASSGETETDAAMPDAAEAPVEAVTADEARVTDAAQANEAEAVEPELAMRDAGEGSDATESEPEEEKEKGRRTAKKGRKKAPKTPAAESPPSEAEAPSTSAEAAAAIGAASDAAPPTKAKSVRKPAGGPTAAISKRGHTNRGRVRQKSHKSAELVEVGTVRSDDGWFNAGYIFPEGFKSHVSFRSSVELEQLCVHECTIIGRGGANWPAPTFKVIAKDRPDEPLVAKSCTGCWTAVLKRINGEIEHRRKAGEDLPPPPKTAIAGPEYFGLNQPEIIEAIEALDADHKCELYWRGKEDRMAITEGLPLPDRPDRPPPRPRAAGGGGRKRTRNGRGRRRDDSDEDEDGGSGNDDEDVDGDGNYMTNRWSGVSRTERYRKRCGTDGEPVVDEDNPLPGFMDPITFEPVAVPAISPYGHVMGMATWKAVLAEKGRCPFTANPLTWHQCTVLTKNNIERFRDRIIH